MKNPMRKPRAFLLSIVILLAPAASLAQPDGAADAQAPGFGLAEARHLLNRAAFGAPPGEIRAFQALGARKAVKLLLSGGSAPSVPGEDFAPHVKGRPGKKALGRLSESKRRELIGRYFKEDRAQYAQFRAWWIEEMIETEHPLKEKMALFWHGYFTSAQKEVRNSYLMVQQNELFREFALGNFRTLLTRVARDPAMLSYLDNDQNRKGNPNENFARELMELFTLGVGNYTENDIKEAARAFTGWTFQKHDFRFQHRMHDSGEKTVLGETGRLGGEQVIQILLRQEAAPRFLSRKILGYFAGPYVSESMVDRYARLLRQHNWELKPVIRKLFTDPEFYGPEIMGSRILGPVEYVVGICRRLEETPPGIFLAPAAEFLGQSLLNPPNVKGWEGGDAWITTATFLQRGNIASWIIEGFDAQKIRTDLLGENRASPAPGSSQGMQIAPGTKWHPTERIRWLLPAKVDSAEMLVDVLCDRFLGVQVTDEARRSLLGLFNERENVAGKFRLPPEPWLKRLVRLILSLPEAQLG